MYVLYDLQQLLILGVAFLLIFFLVNKFKTTNFFYWLRIPSILIPIYEGVIYGVVFYGAQAWSSTIYSSTGLFYFVMGAILVAFFSGLDTSLYSLSISFPLTILFNVDVSFNLIFSVVSLIATLIFWLSFDLFVESDNSERWSLLFFVVISSLFYMIMVATLKYEIDSRTLIETTFLIPIYLFILYEINKIIFNFLISANLLYESINFYYSRYYRTLLHESAIASSIQKHNFNFGLYGIFSIHIDRDLDNFSKKELVETVLSDIEKKFGEDIVLFKDDGDKYGFFKGMQSVDGLWKVVDENFYTSRSEGTFIDSISNVFSTLPKKYKLLNQDIVLIKVKIGLSIYGVHDGSIDKLHNYSNFAHNMVSLKQHNSINVFDYKTFKTNVHDRQLLSQLDSIINLDNFDIRYYPVFNLDTNETIFNIARPFFVAESHDIKSVDSLKNELSINRTFDRYFATTALLTNSPEDESPIGIDYYPLIFVEDFQLKTFLQKIYTLRNDLTKIIFIFDYSDLELIFDWDTFTKNIVGLRESGIKFCIRIIEESEMNHMFFEKINPEYAIYIHKSIIYSRIKRVGNEIVVADGISSPVELSNLKQTEISHITGGIMSFDNKPHDVNQSTMDYLSKHWKENDEH